MSDYLGRLAARAIGTLPTVSPRLPARFEPLAAPSEPPIGRASSRVAEPPEGWETQEQPDSSGQLPDEPAASRPRAGASSLPRPGEPELSVAVPPDRSEVPTPRRDRPPAPRDQRPGEAPAPTPRRDRPSAPRGQRTGAAPGPPPRAGRPAEGRSPSPAAGRRATERSSPGEAPHPQPAPQLQGPADDPLPADAGPAPLEPLRATGQRPTAERATRPSRAADGAAAEPPTVEVTIGRLEIRALRPEQPGPRRGRPEPRLSLDEYLDRRRGGSA